MPKPQTASSSTAHAPCMCSRAAAGHKLCVAQMGPTAGGCGGCAGADAPTARDILPSAHPQHEGGYLLTYCCCLHVVATTCRWFWMSRSQQACAVAARAASCAYGHVLCCTSCLRNGIACRALRGHSAQGQGRLRCLRLPARRSAARTSTCPSQRAFRSSRQVLLRGGCVCVWGGGGVQPAARRTCTLADALGECSGPKGGFARATAPPPPSPGAPACLHLVCTTRSACSCDIGR